jgi:hypothetical protein
MRNIVEQAAAGALLVVFMAGLVAVAIGFVAFCDRLKDRLSPAYVGFRKRSGILSTRGAST